MQAPTRTILVALVAGLLLVPSGPGRADPAPDRPLPSLLGRIARDGEVTEAELARLREVGSPAEVIDGLRTWRPDPPEAGSRVLALEDGDGRETELVLAVPEGPPPEGGWPLVVLLHGLGGSNRQLLRPFGDPLLERGWCVAAPSAERPTRRNVDVLSERPFPHWWSYRPGSFPLRAVDLAARRLPLDRDRVVLCGYSMGGFGTWNIGLRNPDRFAGIVPLAGGISRMEYLGGVDERSRSLLTNALDLPVWFCHGARDRVVPTRLDRRTAARLEELGAPATYREVDGVGHVIGPLVRGDGALRPEMFDWMEARRRDPHPDRVDHATLDPATGRCAWLRIEALRTPDRPARIVAVIDGNRVICGSDNVRELTLFGDPALLDLDRPVAVSVNGRLVHEGRLRPSHEAVADSWRDRRDPQLAYPARVRLVLD